MTHTSEIRLNFVSIKPNRFQFTVWRKVYSGETKEEMGDLYYNSLPGNIADLDNWKKYWISFVPRTGFEEFICQENLNIYLTKFYLFYLLKDKVNKNLNESIFFCQDKGFRKRIYFIINKFNEGEQVIWMEPYYFEAKSQFGFLMDFNFRKNPDIKFSRHIQKLSLSLDERYRNNRNFYIDRFHIIESFKAKYGNVISPLISELENYEFRFDWNFENTSYKTLEPRLYLFGKGGNDSQYRGIQKYGALETINENIKLFIIFEKADKLLAEELKSAFCGKYLTFKGFDSFFNVKTEIVEFQLENFSKVEESVDCLEIEKQNSDYLIMPIIIIEKQEKLYYYIKQKFLEKEIPSQVVTRNLISRKEQLKWSIANIALQIFSKLGGKPWKVNQHGSNTLIIGIGQAHKITNKIITKYLAYSVLTDSSGIYKKICVLGKAIKKEDYLKQLRNNIVKNVEDYIVEGFNEFVLHIPFKIRREEIDEIRIAIDAIVEKNPVVDYMDFIVIKINVQNKYFGYAYSNSLVPLESAYMSLSNNYKEYLVWFKGLKDQTSVIKDRPPGPVHIEFIFPESVSSEEGRVRFLQDLYNLAGANWRGFNATNIPISVHYCQLIATFLKNFPEEGEFLENYSIPWFL